MTSCANYNVLQGQLAEGYLYLAGFNFATYCFLVYVIKLTKSLITLNIVLCGMFGYCYHHLVNGMGLKVITLSGLYHIIKVKFIRIDGLQEMSEYV
jgi:hypothetical protein